MREMASPVWLRSLVAAALDEDLGSGDVTSEFCIPPLATASGEIVAKADGVLAGMAAAREVVRQVDEGLRFEELLGDGDELSPGAIVARVSGTARPILACERTALNFLQQLSGVATLTRAFADRVRGTGARVVDTRKTVPGLRRLQKAAVRAGGGANHRFGLYDAILIKDNHIAVVGGVREALAAAKASAPHMVKIEIEVTSPQDAEVAADLGADVVLLDNMTPEQVGESVALIRGRATTEVSGGVTLQTIADYARQGANLISVGALTHSAPAVDMSLEITEWTSTGAS
jgi:nicotinate-nucleotide pyrophosphorylase (carboxylating)